MHRIGVLAPWVLLSSAFTWTAAATDVCVCPGDPPARNTTTQSSSTTTTSTSTVTTSTSTTIPSTTTTTSSTTTNTSTTTTTTTTTTENLTMIVMTDNDTEENLTTTSTTTTSTTNTTSTTTTNTTTTATTNTTTTNTTTTTISSSTTTTTVTCPPCGASIASIASEPGAPAGFVCGSACADLSWDFVGIACMMSIGGWLAMFVGGIGLAIYNFTSNVDDMKELVDIWLSRLQSSMIFCTLYFVLAIVQCVIFSIRTFSKSVLIPGYAVELLAVALYSVNLLMSWVQAYWKGLLTGVIHTFTWGAIDALLIPSVVCLCLIKVDGAKSWFSLSFLASVHIFESWRWLVELRRLDLKVLKWQTINVAIPCIVIIFLSGMMMMSLENLGDPEFLESLNEDTWTVISSLYFVFITVSTVGYGDLAPVTTLGRLFAIVAIFGGISAFLHAIHKVLQVMNLRNLGGGHFTPRVRIRHIVVTGNPTAAMTCDFISELFHADHAEDAEDLHLILMLPRGCATAPVILKFLKQRQNLHIAPRVHMLQGSVLERNDLQRVCPKLASAFFVLPSIQCTDHMHEDTENIIRMMAVLKVAPQVRMILLLMKAEHEQLLHDTGVGNMSTSLTCLAMDQFKFNLVGKSALVPGFASMICNLFKTIADADDDSDLAKSANMAWLGDYDMGTGNELYEVELSPTYAQRGAVFSEVVLDVIEQTDGRVYLIGLVESGLGQKKVMVNPGCYYPIKPGHQGVSTNGIFIAAERDCVIQCDGGVFLGRRERPAEGRPEESGALAIRNDDGASSLGSRPGSSDPKRPLTPTSRAQSRAKSGKSSRPMTPSSRAQAKKGAPVERPKGTATQERATSKGNQIVPASQPAAPPPPGPPPPPTGPPPADAQKKGNAKALTAADKVKQRRELAAEEAAKQKEIEDHKIALNLLVLEAQQRKAAIPLRPPLKLLAKGGHVLFLCVGAHPGDELRLGAEHFLRPMRLVPGNDVPLVVLAPVPPRDWHRVSEAKEVYFLKGSPLSLFDLERANFRACSVIFVCHVSSPRGELTEEWQVDSEVICCLRLIESELPWGSPISVIVEVTVDSNFPFVALSTRPPGSGAAEIDDFGRQIPRKMKWRRRASSMLFAEAPPLPEPVLQLPEYYRQPRFACGQLFVGNVITSLVVNTFYNPSLWELVHTMITSQVVMVPLPKSQEGKSYYEYFDYLLRQQELMPVAIYRFAEAHRKDLDDRPGMAPRKWSYVFTAPPAKETHMMRGDSVMCFEVGAGGLASIVRET